MYLSKLTLIGFIGAEVERKTGDTGAKFVAFSVEFAAILKKGAHIQVKGELRSREYEKDGVNHRVFECRIESILKLDRAARHETSESGDDPEA